MAQKYIERIQGASCNLLCHRLQFLVHNKISITLTRHITLHSLTLFCELALSLSQSQGIAVCVRVHACVCASAQCTTCTHTECVIHVLFVKLAKLWV